MFFHTIPVFKILTAFEGKIAEFIGVTSSVLRSSLLRIDCNKGFLDLLCIVISIGFPHFRASFSMALNSFDSDTNFPTSSTKIRSASSIALATESVAILLTASNLIPSGVDSGGFPGTLGFTSHLTDAESSSSPVV